MKFGILWLAAALTWFGGPAAYAEDVPGSGPERLAWMREHLSGTVSKFAFTQGYSFRKNPDRLRPFLQAVKARGFNVWDQMAAGGIWGDEQFASLERSIRAAGQVGLNVWATLSPPSGQEKIARMPEEERRQYYFTTAERFAHLAKKYPNFVAFTCDDFDYNFRFFTPEMLAEMARRWRAICPRLAFLPLLYYKSISEEFFATRGDSIDGVVFHFRADSYPYAHIPAYDPKNFDMYGDVMRYELKRVRRIAGRHPVVCGIYIWYYESGWGVLTPDEKNPAVEHIVRDATQKIEIAHQFADGVRVYGLGVDHDAYRAMGERARKWRTEKQAWAPKRGEPKSPLGRWQRPSGKGPFLGTLLADQRGIGCDLPKVCPWQRLELVGDFRTRRFDPAEAARRYPLLVVSRTTMSRDWPGLLEAYARAGGTLVLEFVPGWQLDVKTSPAGEGEQTTGDRSVLTRRFGELAGVEFHYHRRGFATRWRVVKDHALAKGLGEIGRWQEVSYQEGRSAYPYLVHPVKPADGEVLVEVEHEVCPYDGVEYVRKGKTSGVYPLLTVKQCGDGLVIRHYAAVSPGAVFGEAYDKLLQNVLELVPEEKK